MYDVPEAKKSVEVRNSHEVMKALNKAKVITSKDDVLKGNNSGVRVLGMNKMVLEMLQHIISDLNVVKADVSAQKFVKNKFSNLCDDLAEMRVNVKEMPSNIAMNICKIQSIIKVMHGDIEWLKSYEEKKSLTTLQK
ncbi:hypothetical protein V6N13_088995 [Hibiscus sabdariffa]|uniref:Uncharacterized protein n=1 Tax=Hibiscus sabdariffa TaxID=183260 RepID=A0ABR2G125_9ROSI